MSELESELDWSVIVEGKAFPAVSIDLDDQSVDAYLQVTGETHRLYSGEQGGYVPPMYTTLVRIVKSSLGGRWPSGTIQLDHRLAVFRPLRRRERLSIDVTIGSASSRNGRSYFETVSSMRDHAGLLVGEQAATSMWAGAVNAGAASTSSKPASPQEAAGGAHFARVAVGTQDRLLRPERRIGPITARYSLQALREFGRIAGALDPIHVDPAFARGTRYGRNIVQGRLVMTLPARLMLEYVGERWLDGGELSVQFRRPLFVDQSVLAWAAPTPDPCCLEVWCENDRRERVIEGFARVGREGPEQRAERPDLLN